ncbi:MAG: hypothetical protein MJB57_15105 [Gemmatimonadetes bacterium]|nr:hypothetical protein [Gemmatimonadota bacterium]
MSTELPSLDRTAVVLHEPQDLVNIALVIRAMKNMGLARLRLVRPVEFDAWRITGVAHDTHDIVEAVEIYDELSDALADANYALAATARRRSSRQDWWTPEQAAAELLPRGSSVALLFGREDRGLPNDALDLCHGAVSIPVNPNHPSMNIAHAAVVILYEWRKAAMAADGVAPRDMSFKTRRQTPPATHEALEDFFDKWQTAMEEVGLFHGIDPIPKMRSFRSIFQRSDLDMRELGLMQAAAYEVLHFAQREKKRARERLEKELG